MDFVQKLVTASRKNQSLLCVGLDPEPKHLPAGVDVLSFNKAIIEATADLVCSYKLNVAFYEALGEEGFGVMKSTIESVPDGIPVIGDAKRGDIGHTAEAYVCALFDKLGFDAATVNPYMGYDSLEPFIEKWDKGVFIVCRTSNPGSSDFQNLLCQSEGKQLYKVVASRAAEWNKFGNIGLVVGATQPEDIEKLRKANPDMPLLIPGVGAQGGDLATAVCYGIDAHGEKAIINSSRQIIYASNGADFAEAARKIASRIKDQINSCRGMIKDPKE